MPGSIRSPLWPVWRWSRRHAPRLPAEEVSLAAATGRVLTENLLAPADLPPFERAAMDGYALALPLPEGPLRVVGEVVPGRPAGRRLGPGEALRILTGAAIPAGAAAVVAQERTRREGEWLWLVETPAPGQHIERAGSDIARGTALFSRGRRLRIQDAALLVRSGRVEIPVLRRPRVRLLATGDEVMAPGSPLAPGQLPEANVWMLAALARRDGAEVVDERWLPDEPGAILGAMAEPGADVVVVTGGSGPGDRDFPPRLLAEHGELAFHGLALQPAASTGVGRLHGVPVWLLPGNPVSCLCAYELLVGRMLRRLGGLPGRLPQRRRWWPLGEALHSRPGVLAYWRVRVRDGRVWPVTAGAASRYGSVTGTDGFVLVAPSRARLAAGARVGVYCYD